MTLRAVVIGAGWAGEGHTVALRAAGVEVVALCGRTPDPAKAMAQKLGIEDVRFDWRQALEEVRPDIVSIATPAAPHREMAEFAARLGCHVMCDKPLGVNAKEAKLILVAVERARVKHAYGSTSRYAPVCRYACQLLANGLIGRVREIESTLHINLSPLLPYSWFHSLALGGGALNNVLTHKLGQVLYITGGKVTAVAGEARRFLERAPVGEPIHDFRTFFGQQVQPDETTEWRAVDADLAYTVLAQLELPDGTQASGLFKCSGMAACRNPGYLAFYGERGTLHLSGPMAPDHIEHFDPATGAWQELSVPPEVIASLPQLDDAVQRDWNQLFRSLWPLFKMTRTLAIPRSTMGGCTMRSSTLCGAAAVGQQCRDS
jgi:predicted dehydrogenase